MFNMMGKIGEAQEKMQLVKQRLGTIILEESELEGVVVIQISADKKIKKITINDEFYNKYDNEEREDILLEALNNALEKAELRGKEEMKNEMKGILPNIPGLNLDEMPFPF